MLTQEQIYEMINLDKRHFLHPSTSIPMQQANGPEFIFTEGNGVFIKDVHGRSYIDGLSSLWNVNIGYGRKELAQTAMEQMLKLPYSSTFGTLSHEPAIRLATKIAELMPGDLTTTFFTSGGSESTDTAFKLVRHYWKVKGQPEKTKIIARENAYHGLTTAAASATGIKHFNDFIGSKAPDFFHVEAFSPKALREKILMEGPETIAAFIAEPVQGAGGIHIPYPEYFQEIREICDEFKVLFIADEVITGFGRTGKMFGMENWGVIPDLICFAKGVTSGYFPLGGVTISERIHQELIKFSNDVLFHGFTYSGHPVACAVALKNIEILETENLVGNAKEMGDKLLEGLIALQKNVDFVGHVNGLGLMASIEVINPYRTEKLANKIAKEASKRGLFCRSIEHAGQDKLVLAPPLIITEHEIAQILFIIHESIQTVAAQLKNKQQIKT